MGTSIGLTFQMQQAMQHALLPACSRQTSCLYRCRVLHHLSFMWLLWFVHIGSDSFRFLFTRWFMDNGETCLNSPRWCRIDIASLSRGFHETSLWKRTTSAN